MDFQYVYLKKRSEFGRQCFFTSEPGAISCDIPPNPELAARFIHVDPVHRGTQVGCEMSEHEVSTDRAEYATTGVNHAEGGWAKDINPQDVEQTTRFKKKVEKDDVYMSSVLQLGAMMEHCIKQNNTLDIYEEYFGGEDGAIPGENSVGAKTVNVFRDPCPTHRAVSCLSWSPDSTRLAAAYTSLRFQASAQDLPVQSFVWDVENPSRPDSTLTPPDSLVSLEFNPKESFVLAGGTYRGRVCWFDRRRGTQPVEVSTLEASHRDPVYSTIWVNSKSGTEIFTASTDGMVMWWDTRKITEPTETLILDVNKTQEPSLRLAQGATVLEYETTIPTKFMLGTEQGTVIQCNRKGKTQTEKISAVYSAHLGSVRQVQRNPAFLKNFLTIGDWCAKVWSEECKESAIFWTDSGEVRLTDGSWSPTRPSVFFTSKADGTVDVWDVLYQQRLPVLTIQVGDSPLETLRVQESGAVLAAGSTDGQITLLELSDGLVTSLKNDRLVLTAMFERETRREKILEGKNREARLQKKMRSEGNSAVSERSSLIPPGLTASARAEKEQIEVELIEEAQNNFFDIVYKEKASRQEQQLLQMGDKGVTAELDSVDFQAPDLSADSPGPQDGGGADLAAQAAAAVSKTSAAASKASAAASKTSAAASKTSAVASRTSAIGSKTSAAASKTPAVGSKTSAVGSKASAVGSKTSAADSKTSAVGSKTSAVVSKTSAVVSKTSAAAAATGVSSSTGTAGSTTSAGAAGAASESAGSSSMVTAPGDEAGLGQVMSVADEIADVVDGLEEAVDDLLDPSREETDVTSPGDTSPGNTES